MHSLMDVGVCTDLNAMTQGNGVQLELFFALINYLDFFQINFMLCL